MPKRRISLILPVMITIIALPATLSLLYYRVTGDPTMQPLSVTKSSLEAHQDPDGTRGILVQINWGKKSNSPSTPAAVQEALDKTLTTYAVDYRINLIDTPGDKVQIYFLVNASKIGPYRISNVASGIPAALAALRQSARN